MYKQVLSSISKNLPQNLIFILFILSLGVVAKDGNVDAPGILSLQMPYVKPQQDNAYLCHSAKIDPNKSLYLTKFKPLDNNHAAHHMLLYGCEEPGSYEDVWNCGEMASSKLDKRHHLSPCKSKPSIIYAWAHNAPELTLPQKTGFKIGANSKIKWLVLQIHYAHVDIFKNSPTTDNSGIQLTLTDSKLPQEAGVILLVTGGSIPANSIETMEVACEVADPVKLHPFAYRTHTHKLGYLVSGYVIKNNHWIRLGQKSPQLEQMFYPIENNVTIEKDDILAARCIMNNNGSQEVFVGPTMEDEMCNFYIMYYHDSPDGSTLRVRDSSKMLSEKNCLSPGPPFWYWKDAGLTLPQELEPMINTESKEEAEIFNSVDDSQPESSRSNDVLKQELDHLIEIADPDYYDYTL